MWGIILKLVLKLIAWLLEKLSVNKETKNKFYEFVRLAANDTSSVKLMKWGEAQLKWLRDNPWA